MSVFVDNNARLEIAISLGVGSSPDVHSHTAIASISRGSKVGIVRSAAVLSVNNNEIICLTALSVVICLEVSCYLVEAKDI